jgi:hypothetical protein
MSIFVEMGLKDKIPVGKLVVSDQQKDSWGPCKNAATKAQDDSELEIFKSRV